MRAAVQHNASLPAADVLGGASPCSTFIHCERAAHGQEDTILVYGPVSRVKEERRAEEE